MRRWKPSAWQTYGAREGGNAAGLLATKLGPDTPRFN
jgi:hypothetical protein